MKRALVISGGGSKGAFAVGVLKELYSIYPTLDFDIYVGTSAGSLVVSLASLNRIDVLEKVYTSISNADLFIEGNIVDKIGDTSLFDVTPAWKLIQKYYPDTNYDLLLASGKKVFLTTACLQTNDLHVFTNDVSSIQPTDYNVVQTINANHFRRAMLASACEPVFMNPIQVGRDVPGAANPGYQYVDGGVIEYIGLQMAIDAGATEIFAILLSPEKSNEVNPPFTNLLGILGETVDILTNEVGKNDVAIADQYVAALKYISEVKSQMLADGITQASMDKYFTLPHPNIFQNKEGIKMFKIRPRESLGGGPGGLTFDPNEMKGMVTKGQSVFNDFAANLPPGDITWA
ncbi:MAG: patatin-like phospholipase family protein [Ginsengibacter sp.]